jgi:hypothetical protein
VVKTERVYIDADVAIPFNQDDSVEIDKKKLAGIRFILDNARFLLTSTSYTQIHKMMMNTYFHTRKTQIRTPSFFMTWEIFKTSTNISYVNKSYETYISEPNDISIVDLEQDENIRVCSCNTTHTHIDKFFMDLMEKTKILGIMDADMLTALMNRVNWKFYNVWDNSYKLYYEVKYKNRSYFITYQLLHIYYIDYTTILPTSQHIRASTAIYDRFLSIMLISDKTLYNLMKPFLKIGYYHISISVNDPRSAPPIIVDLDNIHNPMGLLRYLENIPLDPPITIRKKIYIARPRKRRPRTPDTPHFIQLANRQRFMHRLPINVRNDFETIRIEPTAQKPIRYYKQIIPPIQITNLQKNIERPTRVLAVLKNPEPTHTIIHYDMVHLSPSIKRRIPTITTDLKIPEIDSIISMLLRCYATNPKFQELVQDYDVIKIIKGLHLDQCRTIKSTHFNILLYTIGKDCSPVYHAYISNNTIVAITVINNILK